MRTTPHSAGRQRQGQDDVSDWEVGHHFRGAVDFGVGGGFACGEDVGDCAFQVEEYEEVDDYCSELDDEDPDVVED